ncbi:MAG: EamA family transporter, partial [Candidatus Bipolaricaulota bacterium]
MLVFASGFLHANWNYLAKKSTDKLSFLWGAKVFSLFIISPVFVYYLTSFPGRPSINNYSVLVGLGAASGVIHVLYVYFLSMAYRYGDISFSYPIARGTAPFIVALFSFLFIGELPSIAGFLGMALIALGIFFLVKSDLRENFNGSEDDRNVYIKDSGNAFIFAILTSLMIAFYIFLDGKGSRVFSPIIFMFVYSVFSTIFFTIPIVKRSKKLFKEIKKNFVPMIATGVLEPLSYFLALQAMQLSQLGYVASLRNISIVFATLLGVIMLKEPFT